jgi:hypothetical protein
MTSETDMLPNAFKHLASLLARTGSRLHIFSSVC